MTKIASVFRTVAISSFLFGIWLPFANNFLNLDNKKIESEKNISELPAFSLHREALKNFFQQADDVYSHNFGFRSDLLFLYSKLMVNIFHVSSNPKIVLGKDGWLYYDGGPQEQVINNYYRGTKPFTKDDLKRITTTLLERQHWLNKKGIPYLVIITPDKETIYPEYLPRGFNKINNQTRTEQLMEYAHKNTDLHIIYIRDILLNEKNKNQKVFYKNDTHWNDLGAYFGYYDIMQHLEKWTHIKPQPLSQFNYRETSVKTGDLVYLLNLTRYHKETNLTLNQPDHCQRKAFDYGTTPHPINFFSPFQISCPGKKLVSVVFRDSYFSGLLPYFSANFKKSTYLWRYDFIPEVIEQEKPDIVVQELVERSLVAISGNPESMKKG